MEDTGENLPNRKEIAYIVAGVTTFVGAWLSYMVFVYDPHRDRGPDQPQDPIERLAPHKKASIISESSGSGNQDPSLLLRQRFPDGRVVTVRKPVFIGEVAIHEPGEKVVPAELEPPLPRQP